MKHINLLIFCMIMSVNCCFAACAPKKSTDNSKTTSAKVVARNWLEPDSIAMSNLGKTVSDILINSTRVRVFSLCPKEKTTPDDVVIQPNFVRDTLLATLNKEQAAALKYSLISCGMNYFNDTTIIPLAPYYPVIEFEFTKKKEVAHVFISMSDFKWGILFEDKTMFKFNYADGTFIHRFCNYFLLRKDKK